MIPAPIFSDLFAIWVIACISGLFIWLIWLIFLLVEVRARNSFRRNKLFQSLLMLLLLSPFPVMFAIGLLLTWNK